ncbi:MAG: (deoxy)nucleoside triphosphate pyrophosphohydrolase [Prevotella sp.]|nr:(deoxy)nucleoside triphosphate pyrophosphohydrolase [Prevotella sp.]
MKQKKRHNVVAAVIRRGDQYLCMRRKRSRYLYISERWEFPGGKVEKGENDYEALIREIREEMDWDIYVGRKVADVDYDYPDFNIHIAAYLCKGSDEDDFKLLDHLDYRWLTRDELDQLDWTDADRKLIEQL